MPLALSDGGHEKQGAARPTLIDAACQSRQSSFTPTKYRPLATFCPEL